MWQLAAQKLKLGAIWGNFGWKWAVHSIVLFSVSPQLDTVFCKRVKKIKRRKTHTGISSSSSTRTQPTLCPSLKAEVVLDPGSWRQDWEAEELQNSVAYYRSWIICMKSVTNFTETLMLSQRQHINETQAVKVWSNLWLITEKPNLLFKRTHAVVSRWLNVCVNHNLLNFP